MRMAGPTVIEQWITITDRNGDTDTLDLDIQLTNVNETSTGREIEAAKRGSWLPHLAEGFR